MNTFILSADLFPAQIKENLKSDKIEVQFQEKNSGILLLSVKANKDVRNIRGIARNSNLTVENFINLKHADRELENNEH
jgi:hypothetical protein